MWTNIFWPNNNETTYISPSSPKPPMSDDADGISRHTAYNPNIIQFIQFHSHQQQQLKTVLSLYLYCCSRDRRLLELLCLAELPPLGGPAVELIAYVNATTRRHRRACATHAHAHTHTHTHAHTRTRTHTHTHVHKNTDVCTLIAKGHV